MKKWIAIVLLVGLTGCSSSTTSDKAPEETSKAAPPANEPPPIPEPPAAPPAEPPKETAKEAPKATPAATGADKAASKAVAKPADKPVATNLKPGLYARFETSMGNFTAELNEKEAPMTSANFAGLADGTKEWTDPKTGQKQKKPYYNGLTFHRIIDNFMIQGGDPLGTGTGGPGFTIKDEPNNLKHDKVGTLAMARTQLPDSAGSQFYITVGDTQFLDGQRPPYVVFGQIVEGLDVVLAIAKVPTSGNPNNRPLTPVVMNKVTIQRVK